MAKYASYDSSVPEPSPVLGWYDADAFEYPEPVPPIARIELSDEFWNTEHRGAFAVRNGVLEPYTPPVPPPTPQQLLAQKIADGIAITCTSNSALNKTFALDSVTMDQIGSVARDFASGLGLPMGAPTFTYPSKSGEPCEFTGTQVVALYRAQRDLLFQLNTQAAMIAHGAPPDWPAQAKTIP